MFRARRSIGIVEPESSGVSYRRGEIVLLPFPIAPYGASKLAGEGYCLAYHASWGLQTAVLRFGNVYGPYSAHKNSVVARFFKDILSEGEITIDGDGQQTLDFIYACGERSLP